MRISLLTKFIISFLITGVVLVGILVSLIRFYAFKNFSDYVAQKDYNSLDSLAQVLEDAYRAEGSWAFLTHNPPQWMALLAKAELVPQAAPLPRGFGPGAGPGSVRDLAHGPPPGPGPPGPWAGPNHLAQRISLLDHNKVLVMGQALANPKMLRPVSDKGRVIGYLGFSQAPDLSHPMDLEFLKAQEKGFWLAGGLFLACSVLASAILAFHLLSPIRKLSMATRKLGQRRFDTRIHLKTRDELGQLAEDFNRMALTLEEYEKRQTLWLSDISHELRTPLSILKGELEAAQDGIRPLNARTIDRLQTEVGHLIRLVSDLNDLAAAEAMALDLACLDLSRLMADIAGRFSPLFREKGFSITLDLAPDTPVMGDPDRLTQLFSNLLENGLAYTGPPGKIRLSCRRLGHQVIARVDNSGPGVDPELLPRLFDRLFRADTSRNRKSGGSGLGLAICRGIANAHQGSIQACPSDLGGISIQLHLPLARKSQGETP